MKTVLHKAHSRGHADHGWLNAWHSFSFAGYYNPERMHFGVLRVLNDDTVQGGEGFGMHPHDNMEIVTIPLEGAIEHKDSMGNHGVIQHGDIQVMSAGTGIYHSEFNHNKNEPLKLLQIWVFPNKKNVEPRYGQMTMNLADRNNKFQQLVSPNENDEGMWIHQDAWFHLGKFDNGAGAAYKVKKDGNGVYAFIINGQAEVNGTKLEKRDALGIWETSEVTVKALTPDTEILLIDVPMVM